MSTASHLRAMARAIVADASERASALDAIADDLERGADAWLALDEAASLACVRPRVLRDAATRGEIALGGAGRRRVVRRADLDAWIASRTTRPLAKCGEASDDRAEARAS